MSGRSASTFLRLLVVVFALFAPPCALAQTGGGGSIQGTITDFGKGAAQAPLPRVSQFKLRVEF